MKKFIETIRDMIDYAAEMIKELIFKFETFWLSILIIIILSSIKRKGEKKH